jgi:plasmid stabilization system protein ParE
LSFSLHQGAERDLAQAVQFYRREAGRGVAVRFLDEFDRVANLLVASPELGIPTAEERRWFPLHGFPYSVIYRPEGVGIRILVVRHQNRDPQHGDQRR